MALERIIQQLGIEQFVNSQTPDSELGVDDMSTVILGTDTRRAYAQVELLSIGGTDNPEVFISRGTTALVNKGMMLQLNVPQKFYGSEALFGIMTGTNPTSVIVFQNFRVTAGTMAKIV